MSIIFVAMCILLGGQTFCREMPPVFVTVPVEECRAGLDAFEAAVRDAMAERGAIVTDFAAFCESGAEG